MEGSVPVVIFAGDEKSGQDLAKYLPAKTATVATDSRGFAGAKGKVRVGVFDSMPAAAQLIFLRGVDLESGLASDGPGKVIVVANTDQARSMVGRYRVTVVTSAELAAEVTGPPTINEPAWWETWPGGKRDKRRGTAAYA